MLEDPVGAALALNRLGVTYHKIKNFEKALVFHQKHLEQTEKENLFAAHFNVGISMRNLKNYNGAIESFRQAIDESLAMHEIDSESFAHGQLGFTYFLNCDHKQAAIHFENCISIASKLKLHRLLLDCYLCLGFLNFDSGSFKESKNRFSDA